MWTLLADYAKEQRLLDPLIAMTSEDLGRSGSWRAIEAMPEIAADDPERWRDVLGWAASRLAERAATDPWSVALLIEKSSGVVPLPVSEPAREIRSPSAGEDEALILV